MGTNRNKSQDVEDESHTQPSAVGTVMTAGVLGAALVRNGFLLPDTSGQRIRSYEVTALATDAGDAG